MTWDRGPVHQPGSRARFTTSNVDEALPGVLSPLTWSFYFPAVDLGGRYAWHGLGACRARRQQRRRRGRCDRGQ